MDEGVVHNKLRLCGQTSWFRFSMWMESILPLRSIISFGCRVSRRDVRPDPNRLTLQSLCLDNFVEVVSILNFPFGKYVGVVLSLLSPTSSSFSCSPSCFPQVSLFFPWKMRWVLRGGGRCSSLILDTSLLVSLPVSCVFLHVLLLSSLLTSWVRPLEKTEMQHFKFWYLRVFLSFVSYLPCSSYFFCFLCPCKMRWVP